MLTTDPLIGCHLGDYRIDEILGRGGMARVYRGYDARLDRFAAVKVIDAHLIDEDEAEYRERFLREARAIARLHHPRIVGVYQFGETDGIYYMAMAFIEGRDLGHILRDCGQQGRLLPYRDVLRIIRDIASALDHAHLGGVIHRDIKPSNIMVMSDGHAVLTDFGLALSVRDGSLGNTFGSAYYIAPEQAVASSSVVPQSDLYALGVVLYQLLVGRVPFDDPSAMTVAFKHIHEAPVAPRSVDSSIPAAVEAVVLRMLRKTPDRRYQSGLAFVRALDKAFARVSQHDMAAAREAQITNTETSASQLALSSSGRITEPKRRIVPRRGRLALLLLTVAAMFGGIAGALLILPQVGPLAPRPTPTTEALGGRVTRTPAPPPATSPPSAQLAQAATAVPTHAAALPTNTPQPSLTATVAPTATATATASPTATATATALPTTAPVTPALAQVRLIYNDRTLTLLNLTDDTLDVSNLQFVQTTADGTTLSFRSNQWQSAVALEAHDCFQVWTDAYLTLPLPEPCDARQAWAAVSFLRWFWTSDAPDSTFEVRRNSLLLATCSIDAGECALAVQ